MTNSRASELHPELIENLAAHTGKLLEVTQISGGMTNKNFLLETERGRFMLRLAGERTELLGINRAHEFACSSSAYSVGVGAKPIAFLEQHKATLTQFIDNADTLTLERAQTQLENIVQVLKRFHAAPAFPSTFSPFETVRDYHKLALEYNVKFPKDTAQILEIMRRIEIALGPHAQVCPCHNDLLPANLLDDGQQIWLVDWEYAGNGNLFFDLGNFAVNLELNAGQCKELLRLYFGFSSDILLAQLHLMRLVSDLREAFWGFLQAGISSLEFDFMAYGEKHLGRFRENVAKNEFKLWLNVLEPLDDKN